MVLYNGGANAHVPTPESRQRVSDLAMTGIPKYLIAEIIEIDDDTLAKHYPKELSTAKPQAVERVGKTVIMQALNGDPKAQALYLKTQGKDYGWVEKQVIENNNSVENNELKDKIKEIEEKYRRDY